MAKIEVDAHQIIPYTQKEVPAFARWTYSGQFLNTDGQTVPGDDDENSDDNYFEAPVTVTDGIATIAAFTGSNKIESTPFGRTAKLEVLTSRRKSILTICDQVRIRDTPTPTTVADIINNSRLPFYTQAPTEFLTLTRFYQLLNGFLPASLATAVIYGLSKLSKIPDDLSNPVALGANERGAANGVAPLDGNAKVALSTIQQISTQKLLGRSTAGNGAIEQLTIGFGLILVDGELSVDIDAIIPGPSIPELSGEIDTLSYVYGIDTPSIDPNTETEVGHYLLILSAPEE